MARLLGCLMCAITFACGAAVYAGEPVTRFLTQEQLEEPAQVAAWLKLNAARVDKRRAAIAHAEGMKDAARNSLGGALKGFGESAIWNPTPQAFDTYVDHTTLYYGRLRRANNNYAEYQEMDLRSFEMLYRSALASDDVLSMLSAAQRNRIVVKAECVARFRRDRTGLRTCAPLQTYSARGDQPGKR